MASHQTKCQPGVDLWQPVGVDLAPYETPRGVGVVEDVYVLISVYSLLVNILLSGIPHTAINKRVIPT